MSIQRVARESGVSVATVSRVFNAPQLVRSDTRGACRRWRAASATSPMRAPGRCARTAAT